MTPSPNSPAPIATPMQADTADNFGVPHDQREGPGIAGLHPSWAAWFNSVDQMRQPWVDFTSQVTINHLGTPTVLAFYRQVGKAVFFRIKISGTSDGANPTISLPAPARDTGQTLACYLLTGGTVVSGTAIFSTVSQIKIGRYDGAAFTGAAAYNVVVQGVYEVN